MAGFPVLREVGLPCYVPSKQKPDKCCTKNFGWMRILPGPGKLWLHQIFLPLIFLPLCSMMFPAFIYGNHGRIPHHFPNAQSFVVVRT